MFTIIGADQKQYGPVSGEEVREWIREGRADGRTLALEVGATEWKPLAAFPEFAAAFVGAPSAVPPILYPPPTISNTPKTSVALPDRKRDFDIGHCLGQGWELFMDNFGLLTAATTLVWILVLVADVIPFAGAFVSGILYGGLYTVYLKRIRGEPVSVGETFSGFRVSFLQLLLAGFLSAFLAVVSGMCCILPWVYLTVAWLFCLPLVMDQRLEFWTAMELSRKVVTRVWFKVFGLAVIAFLPTLLFKGFVFYKTGVLMSAAMENFSAHGAPTPDPTKIVSVIIDVARATAKLHLASHVALLVNLPFATAALMYAYEALFGTRPAPAA